MAPIQPVTPAEAAEWMDRDTREEALKGDVDFTRWDGPTFVTLGGKYCLGMLYPNGTFRKSRTWPGEISKKHWNQIVEEFNYDPATNSRSDHFKLIRHGESERNRSAWWSRVPLKSKKKKKKKRKKRK